jgi:hypothetical protein
MLNSQSDPSGLYGTIVGVGAAFLALLIAFGIPLTPDQTEAIQNMLMVGGPLLTAWLIRRKAWAPTSVDYATAASYDAGREGRPLADSEDLLTDGRAGTDQP